MNAYFEHTPSELINLLADGELPEMKQSELFSKLAANDELKSKFREIMAIRESVRRDNEAFTPPIAATQNVFKNLGFAAPAGSVAGLENLSHIEKISMLNRIFNRISIPIMAATGAALLTMLLSYNYYESKLSEVGNTKVPVVSSLNNSSQNMNQISNITEPVQNNKVARHHNRNVIVAKSDNNAENSVNNDLASNSENNNIIPASTNIISENNANIFETPFIANASEQNTRINSNVIIPVQSNNNSNQYGILDNLNTNNKPSGDNYHYMIQIKGINPVWSNQTASDKFNNSMMLNKSIGIYFKRSQNFLYGFEIGQEQFGQKFIQIAAKNNQSIDYNPNILWVGVSGKYEFSTEILNTAI